MILRTLELKNFGPFGAQTLEFRRGLNLVFGPNDSGKSILGEAVVTALFGASDGKRFLTWGRQGECLVLLTLEGEGEVVRLERDLLTDRVLLQQNDDLYRTRSRFEGRVGPSAKGQPNLDYTAHLNRLFGVSAEDLFRAVFLFGRQGLTDSGGLSPRLKGLVAGLGAEACEQVLSSLAADLAEITRRTPWGEDLGQDREMEEVRHRLRQVEEMWRRRQEGLRELEQVARKIAAQAVAQKRSAPEDARNEADSASPDHGTMGGSGETAETGSGHRHGSAKTEEPPAPLPPMDDERLSHLVEEAEAARKRLHRCQSEANALREQLIMDEAPSWLFPVGLTLGFLGMAGGLAWARPDLLGMSFWGGGLLTALAWLVHFWLTGSKRSEWTELKGRLREVEEEREKWQQRFVELDRSLEEAGLPLSATDLEKWKAEVSMPAADPLEPAAGPPGSESAARGRLAAEEALSRQREQPAVLSRREEELLAGIADLRTLELEGERLKFRYRSLGRRKQVLAAAFEILSQTLDEFGKTYHERFAAAAGRYMERLSGGRFGEIRLAEDWTPALRGKEEEWHPLENFSQGAVDAVGLATRLALADHLGQSRSMFLILDDPLAHFDRNRREEALRMLEQVSARHQLILLTPDETLLKRAARAGWHMISLENKRSVSGRETGERSEHARQLHLL